MFPWSRGPDLSWKAGGGALQLQLRKVQFVLGVLVCAHNTRRSTNSHFEYSTRRKTLGPLDVQEGEF